MTSQAGLCRTSSGTQADGFLMRKLICVHDQASTLVHGVRSFFLSLVISAHMRQSVGGTRESREKEELGLSQMYPV